MSSDTPPPINSSGEPNSASSISDMICAICLDVFKTSGLKQGPSKEPIFDNDSGNSSEAQEGLEDLNSSSTIQTNLQTTTITPSTSMLSSATSSNHCTTPNTLNAPLTSQSASNYDIPQSEGPTPTPLDFLHEASHLSGCTHYFHDRCIKEWTKVTNSKLLMSYFGKTNRKLRFFLFEITFFFIFIFLPSCLFEIIIRIY